MSRRIISTLVSLLMAPSLTAAQTAGLLVKGQQVRVVSRCEVTRDSVARCPAPGTLWPNEWSYSGQLEALDTDTLHIRIRSNGAAFAIPTASIAHLAYADGTRGNTLRGAGIGLLGGALLGGVIGSTQSLEGSFFFNEGQGTLVGVILGAPAGLLVGGVIGALIRSDRWRTVRLVDRIRVAPRLDALGFTLKVTF
jgi:hypothetical protein